MNDKDELDEVPTTFRDWREARRFRAWELHEKGWTQARIAEALGVSRGAVSQWFKSVRENGLSALLSSTSRRGPKPALTAEDLQRLDKCLQRGSEAYEFRGDVWTLARVGKVIEQEFGVAHCNAHVGRLLRKMRWTRQKPTERADQRDEEEIARWHAVTFPGLKKSQRMKNVPSSS